MSNREIDELVTIAIFEWTHGPGPGEFINTHGAKFYSVIPYSTSLAASRELQDKLNELGWCWRIERTPSGAVTVSIWGNFGTVVTMRGTVVETVFALAALKAVGVQEEEE